MTASSRHVAESLPSWALHSQALVSSLSELATRLELLGTRRARTDAVRALAKRLDKNQSRRADDVLAEPMPAWLAQEVSGLVRSGHSAMLEDARVAVPHDVVTLAETRGVGAALARAIWTRSKAETFDELADTMRRGFLPRMPLLGPRERARVEALLPPPSRGMLLAIALDAAPLVEEVLRDAGARRTALVGAARRGMELVPVLEVVAAGIEPRAVSTALVGADATLLVRTVGINGRTVTCTLQGRGELRVACCALEDFWHEVIVRTSDTAHVAWLEDHARRAGFRDLAAAAHDARGERELYENIGLTFVPGEARRGATGAGAHAWLETGAVRGAFHVHTDWSDGSSSLVAMARAAKAAGYEYLGISDHSSAAPYANGLDEARLDSQREAVRRAKRDVPGFTIFHGLEVDILPDGSLDLSDDELARLDFVIASVHTETTMEPRAMTQRLLRALENPFVTMLGHPTGRLLSGKSGYAYDLDAVARAAAANDTWIEINCNGHRLDLGPALARRARAHGVRFAINPDAHSIEGLRDLRLGESVARRAGLAADAVVNTRGSRAMHKLLSERKAAAESRRKQKKRAR